MMKKSDNFAVIPAGFAWNDIGLLTPVSTLSSPDASGSRLDGKELPVDVRNTFIQSLNRLVAAVGVENLMIVNTPDTLLVANRDLAQDVKKVAEQLGRQRHERQKVHCTIHRALGAHTPLEESPRLTIKRIKVSPRGCVSLQVHRHRSERRVMLSSTAQVSNGEKPFTLNPNGSTYIPAGHKDRRGNPGRVPLTIIEGTALQLPRQERHRTLQRQVRPLRVGFSACRHK